jgi:hypothetical protein
MTFSTNSEPVRLLEPLPCWHESRLSARVDSIIALSSSLALIATDRPLPPGTPVYLELDTPQGKAGVDAVAIEEQAGGFTVEFIAVDADAGDVLDAAQRRAAAASTPDDARADDFGNVRESGGKPEDDDPLRRALTVKTPAAAAAATRAPDGVGDDDVTRPIASSQSVRSAGPVGARSLDLDVDDEDVAWAVVDHTQRWTARLPPSPADGAQATGSPDAASANADLPDLDAPPPPTEPESAPVEDSPSAGFSSPALPSTARTAGNVVDDAEHARSPIVPATERASTEPVGEDSGGFDVEFTDAHIVRRSDAPGIDAIDIEFTGRFPVVRPADMPTDTAAHDSRSAPRPVAAEARVVEVDFSEFADVFGARVGAQSAPPRYDAGDATAEVDAEPFIESEAELSAGLDHALLEAQVAPGSFLPVDEHGNTTLPPLRVATTLPMFSPFNADEWSVLEPPRRNPLVPTTTPAHAADRSGESWIVLAPGETPQFPPVDVPAAPAATRVAGVAPRGIAVRQTGGLLVDREGDGGRRGGS